MNTLRMGEFLAQVSQAHPGDFIVMVLDGASSHQAKDLPIPENIRLLPLPPYAPELNPQEHVWDELREKEFPNRVFNHLDAVIRQLHQGLPRLAADRERLRGLTAWPWIISLNLNAHYNRLYFTPSLQQFLTGDLTPVFLPHLGTRSKGYIPPPLAVAACC